MANFITIFRIFLVFISAILVFFDSDIAYIIAVILIITAFSLDGLDGWVARKFNEASKLGAMLDIMSDRIAENTYWVVFAVLGWIPVFFPIIALTRGFVVDGIRSVAMEQGMTAFGDTSMQSSKWGKIICSSKPVRILYAAAKAVAFVFLTVANIPALSEYQITTYIYTFAYWSAYIAIILCVLRGLPVVFESGKLFKNANEKV